MSTTPDSAAFSATGESADPLATTYLNDDARTGSADNGKPSLTVDQAASRLTGDEAGWGGVLGGATTVTYAFRASEPGTMPSDITGFSRFTEDQIIQAEKALQAWSDVANISFTRVGSGTSGEGAYSDNASILFGDYSSGEAGAVAFAYYPGSRSASSKSGDVWVNNTYSYNTSPTGTNYGGLTIVHEIGHALGLSHPSNYNAGEGSNIAYATDASYFEDSRQYTVMSYFGGFNTGADLPGYSSVPLLDDIAAIQEEYGANMTTRTGDTVYGFNSTADRTWFSLTSESSIAQFAVWDAGGNDTFDFSGYSDDQKIDLRQGFFSDVGGWMGNVAVAKNVVIENAVSGSGDDSLYGNSANNSLQGGTGNDHLDGGAGQDTARYSGHLGDYEIGFIAASSWTIKDLRTNHPDGVDSLVNIEILSFSDKVLSLPGSDLIDASFSILRMQPLAAAVEGVMAELSNKLAAGSLNFPAAVREIVTLAEAASSVATLTYEFFTGKAPSAAGMDYLVSPTGPNPNNLNSAYYQSFGLENRYINFSVNLGRFGEGSTRFSSQYAAQTLFEATRAAYATIFGAAPSDEKVHILLDTALTLGGQTLTRADYFAYYGQDGANGLGTKAAMAGWLLAEAVKADVGTYALSNDAFLADVALHHAPYAVDLVGAYEKPEFIYHGS